MSVLFSKWTLVALIVIGTIAAFFGQDVIEYASSTIWGFFQSASAPASLGEAEMQEVRDFRVKASGDVLSYFEVSDARLSQRNGQEAIVTAKLVGTGFVAPRLTLTLFGKDQLERRRLELAPEQYTRSLDPNGQIAVLVRFEARAGESSFTLGIAH
jgi:hypothetical protein